MPQSRAASGDARHAKCQLLSARDVGPCRDAYAHPADHQTAEMSGYNRASRLRIKFSQGARSFCRPWGGPRSGAYGFRSAILNNAPRRIRFEHGHDDVYRDESFDDDDAGRRGHGLSHRDAKSHEPGMAIFAAPASAPPVCRGVPRGVVLASLFFHPVCSTKSSRAAKRSRSHPSWGERVEEGREKAIRFLQDLATKKSVQEYPHLPDGGTSKTVYCTKYRGHGEGVPADVGSPPCAKCRHKE